jgi:4-diphosphocytidyl-2C-methyl-D-erythritol kinase
MSQWREAAAPAKLNLALVVGPRRADGRHEVVTVLERLALADTIAVRRAPETRVSGFRGDTLVGDALDGLASEAGATAHFEARIAKRIPVAAGLGGGSSDAATALLLANDLLNEPLSADRLVRLASRLGADVPFFLHDGSQLATEDGTALEPIRLASGYAVVLVLPHGVEKESEQAPRCARGGPNRDRPRGTATKRPRVVTARRGARAPRRLSRRRNRRRPGRVRPVPGHGRRGRGLERPGRPRADVGHAARLRRAERLVR